MLGKQCNTDSIPLGSARETTEGNILPWIQVAMMGIISAGDRTIVTFRKFGSSGSTRPTRAMGCQLPILHSSSVTDRELDLITELKGNRIRQHVE
jgi:hypothetical protein